MEAQTETAATLYHPRTVAPMADDPALTYARLVALIAAGCGVTFKRHPTCESEVTLVITKGGAINWLKGSPSDVVGRAEAWLLTHLSEASRNE